MANLQICLDEIQIYVGTYKKYNEGSLYGKWLKLTDYSSCEDLYAAMRDLHKDEHDPEFMFQDYEVPAVLQQMNLISESYISPHIYEVLEEIQNAEHNLQVVSAYVDCFGYYCNSILELLEKISDSYEGEFDNDEDFTENLLTQTGCIPSDLPAYVYIDWKSTARDVMMDYSASDGHYFRCL